MHARFAALALILLFVSACGSATPVTPGASGSAPAGTLAATTTASPATTTAGVAPTDTAPPASPINWSELDVCTLLDEQTVKEITGETEVGFTTDGGSQGVNGGDCFWGATRAGVPAYVEITVGNSNGNLLGLNFQGQTCSESPVAGVGTAALGGTCPPPPQRKVYLVAIEPGVRLTVLVNEPKRPLDPDDLAAYVNQVLKEIKSKV